MNVPSIAFVLPGVQCGGSEHVVALLAKTFSERGCRVSLVAFAPPGTKPFYNLESGIDFRAIGLPPGLSAGSRLLYVARRVLHLRSVLKGFKPDLVISFLTRTNMLTLLAQPGCPVVISERNNAERQPLGRMWRLLRRLTYPRAAALVTMTSGAMRQFDDFAPAIRRVIPNHAATFSRPNRDRSGTSLVAVGRLVPQKGFDLLLQAFAKVHDRHPEWTLTIWGEGEQRAALEQQREALGLSGVVYFLGVSSSPGAWTDQADLFVLSSRYEGWGLVVGEAMSAGIPTVAFDCDFGPSEMIDHNETGILVPPEDVEALSAALDRAMSDALLRKRFAAAGQRATERFSQANVVAQWLELVSELIELPNRSRECRDAA